MAAPDPLTLRVGARDLPFRWSMRADFRLPHSRRTDLLQSGIRGDSALVVSIALWAMLDDPRDRLRYPSPEDLHAALPDLTAQPEWWSHAFAVIMLEAFGVDVHAPSPVAPPDPPSEEGDPPPAEEPPAPFVGGVPSPTPSSTCASPRGISGDSTPPPTTKSSSSGSCASTPSGAVPRNLSAPPPAP